jgi:excisionase family DNA binding protein
MKPPVSNCNPTPTAGEHVLALARQLPPDERLHLAADLLGLPPLTEPWLTYAEAAGVLGVSRATVCRLVKRGRLTANGGRGKAKRVFSASVLALKAEAAARAAATAARIVARLGRFTSVSSPVPTRPHPAPRG